MTVSRLVSLSLSLLMTVFLFFLSPLLFTAPLFLFVLCLSSHLSSLAILFLLIGLLCLPLRVHCHSYHFYLLSSLPVVPYTFSSCSSSLVSPSLPPSLPPPSLLPFHCPLHVPLLFIVLFIFPSTSSFSHPPGLSPTLIFFLPHFIVPHVVLEPPAAIFLPSSSPPTLHLAPPSPPPAPFYKY